MLFSKQLVYCGACGKELHQWLRSGNPGSMIPAMAACDDRCREELRIRYTMSILGKEYIPWSKQQTIK